MPTGLTTRMIEHLRQVVLPRDGTELSDGELLGCFIERRDDAAIAALVERHGTMVWGVCRRLLNHHDAEDAFQATFLVLVRKAASIAPREMVGNWLYGVAHQTSLQARRTAARRRTREVQVTAMPDTGVAQQDLWADVQPLLDQELSRLPDIYRVVIVLCDLEGRTRKEVARQLGCPEGTVGGRLARARTMLAKRLSQRGVVLASGALAAVLAQNTASAYPPTLVASNTISAASSFASGPASAGSVSAPVAALTERVLKAMLISKLKVIVAVVLLLGFIAVGATALSGHSASARGEQPATEEKVNAPPRPEPELDRPGARPDLAGAWQGDDWGTVVLRPAKEGGFEGTYSDTFGTDTGRITVRWSAASRRYEGTWSEGTYRFGRIALDAPKDGAISGAYTTDPKCEHQPGVPSLASLKWNKKKDEEKETFTAWGKEVGGLQMGLGLRPGQKRAYHHGETVTLVVRVRNVGKKEVTFSHFRQFSPNELLPTVTDGAGKPIPIEVPVTDIRPVLLTEILTPGKESDLYELKLDLRPTREGSNKGDLTLYGTGKVRFQHERMNGMFSPEQLKRDPDLDKLATGKLELEVREPEKQPQQKEEKTPFTAWGKEINGLQVGLGLPAGQKRVYSHGETVTLVVRLRNIGKEDVKFQYLRQFFIETPPTVTDGDGKPVRLPAVTAFGIHLPVDVTLAPGKEIELYEWKRELRPAKWLGNDGVPSLYRTGTFGVQYERVFGNSSSGSIKIDSELSKLATGKLELEVKSDPLPPASDKK